MNLKHIFAGVVSLLLGAACQGRAGPPPESAPAGEARPLIILHTNDIHGGFVPRETPFNPKGVKVGGFEALDVAVDGIRAEGIPTLLMDAGDLLTGSPATTLPYRGVVGGGMFEMFNLLGYDAWTLGNHEFDGALSELEAGLNHLAMPTLCANLTQDTGAPLFESVKPYVILERGGVEVAVAGLITGKLPQLLTLDALEGMALQSPIDTARALVAEMDPRSDLIVFLTHQGVEDDLRLAKAIPDIDLIIGGHSHTLLEAPLRVGSTVIVQAGSDLFHLGRLDLVVEGDRITTYKGRVIPLNPETLGGEASPVVKDLVQELEAQTDALYGKILGEIRSPLTRSQWGESNIGDWMAELLRKAARTQLAVINSGGIRRDLPAGPLTLRALKGAMPFENRVATFTVTGEELRDIARHNAQASVNKGPGVLQIAGFAYTFVQIPGGVELRSLTVGGEPVSPAALYSIASSDYVVFSQPSQYLGFVPEDRRRRNQGIFDALVDALGEGANVNVATDGRMKELISHDP